MVFQIIKKYIAFTLRAQSLSSVVATNSLTRISLLPNYYRLNDLLWQDGLLIDFVQKKITDKWIRKFLIVSSYLFSERVLFTFAVKFYTDAVIWPSSIRSIFEFSNISLTLNVTLTALVTVILFFNLNCLFILFF